MGCCKRNRRGGGEQGRIKNECRRKGDREGEGGGKGRKEQRGEYLGKKKCVSCNSYPTIIVNVWYKL